MYETTMVEKAFQIREDFNKLCIGYDGAVDCRSLVGPEPFFISQEEALLLNEQGRALQDWFQITLDLCRRAYMQNELKWLGEVVEGGLAEHVISWHRKAHRLNLVKVPLFGRPDMSAMGLTVEVQTPGSGWGYQTACHEMVPGQSSWLGPIEGFKLAVALATGFNQSKACYILYNQPFYREADFFCKRCKQAGLAMEMYFKTVPKIKDVKFVRRPPLEDLISYPGGEDLIKAYFEGQIHLEPSPSLIFDQKIACAFPFHHELRTYYPDSVRTLFPETHLVQGGMCPQFDGQKLCWDEFPSIPRSKRQFILKFAGAKKGLRAGGKAVYNLADCNQNEVRTLLDQALSDWETKRAPWLIQKRVIKKYPVTYLDHTIGQLIEAEYYPMFRPMYLFPTDEVPRIIAFTGLFRKEWKVHGSSDAVVLPVEIRG